MHSESVVTPEMVSLHIGRSVRLVNIESVVDIPAGCPDGRNEHVGWFAFGGDSAKRLRKLVAYEQTTGIRLDTSAVNHALPLLTHNRPGIHLHFDEHMLHNLAVAIDSERSLSAVNMLQGGKDSVALGRLLLSPTQLSFLERRSLANLIAEQADVGCGHWSLLLNKSEEMGVRKELARDFYAATLMLAWASPLMAQLPILHGDHEEVAIVKVLSDDGSLVPLVQPNVRGIEMFIVTPQANAHADTYAYSAVKRVLGGRIDEVSFNNNLGDITARQDSYTLCHLGAAKGKPVFESVVSRDHRVSSRFLTFN